MQFELTKEQTIILRLTARSLQTCPSSFVLKEDEIEGVNWKEVVQEANVQAVFAMAFDSASIYQERIPESLYENWQTFAFTGISNNIRVSEAQRELVELLEKNGFDYVILKGTSASFYYPRAELRILGDIDFLIDESQQEEVERMLEKNGYVSSGRDHVHHVTFKKGKAYAEMHFSVAGIPEGEIGAKLKTYFKNIFVNARLITVDGNTFKAPSTEEHGVILLLHMQQHMLSEGLGLRHLCDWAAYVQTTEKEPFWETSLLPFLKEIGLFRYAAAMTKTSARFLEIPCPDWAENVEESLTEEILGDILLLGNFGRKNFERSKSGQLIVENDRAGTKHGMLGNVVRKLHATTMKQYPIIKKLPILYPFLYVWRALRYLFLSLIGKRPNLLKALPQAGERKSIYKKLEIFEPKNKRKEKKLWN